MTPEEAAAEKAAAEKAAAQDAAQYKQLEADARAFVVADEAAKKVAHEAGLKIAEDVRINGLVAARVRQQLAAFPDKFSAYQTAEANKLGGNPMTTQAEFDAAVAAKQSRINSATNANYTAAEAEAATPAA
jgi:hypothetical protein